MGMDAPKYEDTHNTLWAPGPLMARQRRVHLNQFACPGKPASPASKPRSPQDPAAQVRTRTIRVSNYHSLGGFAENWPGAAKQLLACRLHPLLPGRADLFKFVAKFVGAIGGASNGGGTRGTRPGVVPGQAARTLAATVTFVGYEPVASTGLLRKRRRGPVVGAGDRFIRHGVVHDGVASAFNRCGVTEGANVERGLVSSGRRRVAACAASVLLVVAVAACTAAKASPSQVASFAGSGGPSSSGSAGTASPSPIWTLPASSSTPDETGAPTPTPTPTPTLPTGPLPTVGPVPTGAWTGINWLAIPGGHSPALPGGATGSGYATLEGWSRGYVEFMWNPMNRSLTPWVSADGLTWRAGTKLDTSPWQDDFRSYDQGNPKDRAYHDDCYFLADDFQEGPATLMLTGIAYCTGECTNTFWTEEETWTSADGTSWKLAEHQPGWWLSGGSSGFISYDASSALGSIWTSTDGSAWSPGALPTVPAGSWINSPVAIAGGYVLPGVVMVKKGHQPDGPGTGDGGRHWGCPGDGTGDLSLYQAALWWSPDGKTWTRDTLTGATTSGYDLYDMTLTRIDDHTVVADAGFESNNGWSDIEWVSQDGKTWTHLKGDPVDTVVAGRARGLVYGDSISANSYWPNLLCFNGGSTLTKLHQTGEIPWTDSPQMVLGPSGLLVTVDGSQFWIGVLTTR